MQANIDFQGLLLYGMGCYVVEVAALCVARAADVWHHWSVPTGTMQATYSTACYISSLSVQQ